MGALLRALGAAAGETRYVGGCVRDTLLGMPVSDVDLATRLEPREVIRRLEAAQIKAVPTGLAHGTITAVSAGQPVEVTTLRRDVSTDGRHATVAFTGDWREDAARRDFTINALSADPSSGEIFDYHDGHADLAARRVRFIGDPLTRIAEDHLRILRFFRFHARFGAGMPDAAGLEACAARANDLMALSRERIAGEISRLLALPDPVPTIALMQERAILAPFLPEVGPEGVAALGRLVRREVAIGVPPDVPRRLAALLPQDAEIARSVGARLKISNGWRARLEEYAVPSDRLREPRALAYTIGSNRALSLLLLDAVPDEELVVAGAALRDWEPPVFGIKGGDLIAMGLPAGPLVSSTLAAVRRQWLTEGFPDRPRLEEIARAVVDQALRSNQ
jgi:poly(A) polymerase